MKLSTIALTASLAISALGHAQEPAKAPAAPPVEFPKLEHFEPLWQRSIFTTKDLPSPDAPTGPNFADNLSLSGVYEIDGSVVAVLVDRVTSQVMEARIGSENEMGIKIRKVTPGETVDKTRIQLQKGDQAGWVGFAEAAPTETVQRAVIPTQAPAAVVAPTPRAPAPAPGGASALPPVNPILPPPTPPAQSRRAINDVPLPPP